MRNRVSKKTQWGIMVLVLVCLIITLMIRIFLRNELEAYEAAPAETFAASETEEQFIYADAGESAPKEDSDKDLLMVYKDRFDEIDVLFESISGMEQGTQKKEYYQKIADLWDYELKSLEDDITSGMTEDEKKNYFDAENAFLVSRNHECMKVVGRNKVSVMEGIDYLNRYIELTREHCMDLFKDYSSRLAS